MRAGSGKQGGHDTGRAEPPVQTVNAPAGDASVIRPADQQIGGPMASVLYAAVLEDVRKVVPEDRLHRITEAQLERVEQARSAAVKRARTPVQGGTIFPLWLAAPAASAFTAAAILGFAAGTPFLAVSQTCLALMWGGFTVEGIVGRVKKRREARAEATRDYDRALAQLGAEAEGMDRQIEAARGERLSPETRVARLRAAGMLQTIR